MNYLASDLVYIFATSFSDFPFLPIVAGIGIYLERGAL